MGHGAGAQNGDKGDWADMSAPFLGIFIVRLNSQHRANPSQDQKLHKNLAEMLTNGIERKHVQCLLQEMKFFKQNTHPSPMSVYPTDTAGNKQTVVNQSKFVFSFLLLRASERNLVSAWDEASKSWLTKCVTSIQHHSISPLAFISKALCKALAERDGVK